VGYGNGTFVALRAGILTSPDGYVWTKRMGPVNFSPYGIAFGNGNFVVVGYTILEYLSKIATSSDGVTWEEPFSTSISLSTVTYADKTFLAAGGSGLIIQSDHVVGPRISVQPRSIDFGKVVLGDYQQTIKIQNQGTDDLVLGIADSPSLPFYKLDGACLGQTLPPGGECTISIRYSPSSIGVSTSWLNILSNDPDRPDLLVHMVGRAVQ